MSGTLGCTIPAKAAEEQRRYVTNYIGSKQRLIDFIWENTPDDARAVADLFSGSWNFGDTFLIDIGRYKNSRMREILAPYQHTDDKDDED